MADKKKVKLIWEFDMGPVFPSELETGECFTEVPVIDNDLELRELNRKAGMLFNSTWKEDLTDLDEALLLSVKDELTSVIHKLLKRLDEINDGSFTYDDHISYITK